MENIESYVCPITYQIMKYPVIATDGHSYEKEAIIEWFKTSKKSPMTGLELKSTDLIPNHALRNSIEEKYKKTIKTETSEIELKRIDITNTNYKQIIISPPRQVKSIPIAIVAVIDISGSMGLPCTENNTSEVIFSRLDIVKHSIRTIAYLLRDCDILSIVTFNEKQKIIFPFSHMTQENIVKLNSTLDNIECDGSTNIISGLSMGMNIAKTIDTKKYYVNVCFLTDGEHTMHIPNIGIYNTIENIYNSIGENIVVNTIAYGYGSSLDSKIMYKIAERCNGIYAYVPDGTMVGTIFINLIANLQNVYIDYFNIKDRFPEIKGNLPTDQTKIIYNKNISSPDYVGVQTEFVDILKRIIEFGYQYEFEKSKELAMNFYDILQNLKDDIKINRIIEDIYHIDKNKGQIVKAIENWNKWGMHYLPSVYMSHMRQERSNFKDESMKNYGGENFESILNKADELFTMVIPPPISTIVNYSNPNKILSSKQFTQSYYNTNGGCFTGDTFIKLHNGMYKRINKLDKNDILFRPGNNGKRDEKGVKIKCIVKIKYNDVICIINNILGITPWHPILSSNKWIFPKDTVHETGHAEYVYNFVLEDYHIVYLSSDNIPSCTFGHGFSENEVIKHDYLGTQKIINDLQKLENYWEGYCTVSGFIKKEVIVGIV